ncbi:MAG: hypothetical protein Q7R95_01040, partial [bacterium]|nr:hypothetical protein [bacterium]
NTGSGVDNSHNKTTHEGTNKTLLCDDITLSIVSELCKIYKDNEGNLQMKLLNMLNDAKPN